jgi:ankyrin repeat protein
MRRFLLRKVPLLAAIPVVFGNAHVLRTPPLVSKPMPDGFYEQLRTAYASNDVEKLKDLLERYQYDDYYTDYEDAMEDAISKGSYDIVAYIFDNKLVSAHYYDYKMNGYLASACRHGNVAIVSRVLREMPGVPYEKYMRGIIDSAVKGGRTEVLKVLFAEEGIKLRYGCDLLHSAAEHDNREIFDIALTFRSAIEQLESGKSPIRHAARNGNLEMVEKLLAYPEVVRHCHLYGENVVLSDAAESGNVKIVDRLLEFECIKDRANAMFNKALNRAMSRGHWEVFDRLCQEERVRDSLDWLEKSDKNYKTALGRNLGGGNLGSPQTPSSAAK